MLFRHSVVEWTRFRLLGPVEVRAGQVALPSGRPRQLAMLAALLMRANDTVSVSHLCEATWDVLPKAADSNVRTYVAKIRRQLDEQGLGDRITTHSRGYRLSVRPGELDVLEFESAVARGRLAGVADPAAAAEAFAAALRLWRGRPFENLDPGPALRADRTRLEEQRLAAAEGLAGARIALGQHDTAVAELQGLVAEHPTKEELVALLMLALHGAGRQADALDVFATTRRVLVSEFGVEPGARLRAAHQQVLTEPAHDRTGSGRPTVTACHQLPLDAKDFTGRGATLESFYRQVANTDVHTTSVVVVAGMAGVGKTRFAVHAAHELVRRGHFGDVQLWADLRGFDPESPPADPAGVLQRFLVLLGVPPEQVPADAADRAALYRDRLSSRKALVLLDNAVDEEQVRPLVPGGAGCLVLVTSRRALPDLDGAGSVHLEVFSTTEAVTLLGRIVGEARVAAEADEAERVVQLCGRLPIAVAIAGQRLHNRPKWTVRDLAGKLGGTTDVLDQLHGRSRAVRAVFDLSHRMLPPRARRVFQLTGLHPGGDVAADSVAALAGITPAEADDVLEELGGEHLLQEVAPGRWRPHDLVRQYARERALAEQSEVHRDEATRRLLHWYLHAAAAASRVLNPDGRPVPLDPGHTPAHLPEFRTRGDALGWFETERAALVVVVAMAAERGEHEVAWRLPCALLSFLYLRKHWDDWSSTHQAGLAAARRAGDTAGQARILNGLGVLHSDLGRLEEAVGCHRAATPLFRRVGDPLGAAWNLNNLGVAYDNLHCYDAAADCYRNAVPLFRAACQPHGESISLGNLGDAYRELGQFDAAADRVREALEIQRRTGDRAAARFTLCSLGDLRRDTGQPAEAAASYRRALAISREVDDRRGVAKLLCRLAELRIAAGSTSTARDLLREAHRILTDLADPRARTVGDRVPDELPMARTQRVCVPYAPASALW